MTPRRAAILNAFRIDENGRIKDPGKFEGEMLYVPDFWRIGLDGGADEDDGEVFRFVVTPEDREAFPEINGADEITLSETNQGFVVEG